MNDEYTAGGRTLDRNTLLRRAAALGLAPAALAAAGSAARASATAGGASAHVPWRGIPGMPWQSGKRGGTGRVAFQEDRISLDPPLAYDWVGYYGIQNFHRGLLYFGPNTTPQLDLAASMDVSPDARRYLFRLKRGVTFHNGRELTSADFKFTWERSSSKQIGSWVQNFLGAAEGHAAFVAGRAKHISGIRTPDKYTIDLRLTRGDVTIPGVLGIPPFYALPSKEVQAAGKKWQFTMGTGPFKLDELDQGGRKYTASRFEDYVYAKQLPYFDHLEWSWGVDPQLEFLRVLRGDLDAVGAWLRPTTALKVEQSGKYRNQLAVVDTLSLNWLGLDLTQKPFDDIRVRKAFNYAIDRQRLKPAQINPTGHFWPPALLGYDPRLKVYPHDPERARSLLKQAGHASGLELTLPIFQPSTGQIEQLVQQDLKAVGVKVTLKNVAANIYDVGAKLSQQYRFWFQGWGMGLPDPAELTNSLIGTKAPSNYGGYSNARIDRLATAAQAQPDRAKRAQLYAEIERLLLADAPFVFLGVNVFPYFHGAKLHNFQWEPVNYEQFDRMWLA